MTVTKIANVVVPEVFNPYVVQRTMEKASIFVSGLAQRTEQFDQLASQAARTVNMPYWGDLTGDDENLNETGGLTPGNIAADKDIAVILRRGRAWGATDLAANLAGDDPMLVIAELVSSYWARRLQAAMISTLKGVFAAASMSGNVLDISALAGGDELISAASFVDATQKLGDAKDLLTAVLMHSAVNAYLAKLDLIDYAKDSSGNPTIPTYMGKAVIVDDSLAPAAGVYTTYLFGTGAIGYGEGSPVGFIPSETDRDSLGSEDYLITRKTFILHPRGVAFQSAVVAGEAPSNTELETATNWAREYENKAIRIVQFKHKIG